jgi:hypothetical protein
MEANLANIMIGVVWLIIFFGILFVVEKIVVNWSKK